MSLIKLDRVEFKDGINRPGPKNADGYVTYGSREKVLVSAGAGPRRLTQGQDYVLWLDAEARVVIVKHPESDAEPEKIPLENVAQYREAAPEKAAKK